VITKAEFVECANSLREYWNWENELERMGIYLNESKAGQLADVMLNLLIQDDVDWGFDSQIGQCWIVNWCSAPFEQHGFARKSQWIYLPDAGALWDFVSEMNELGWPEQVENQRWLK
jgi:hypothetical protein